MPQLEIWALEGAAANGELTSRQKRKPGSVRENVWTTWQLGQVQVYDGGSDSDGNTLGDNTLFADEGVFAP